MLELKHNFGLFGRIFGVPRKFLSQVGAFCASLTSGHSIIDVRVPAFPDPGGDPVKIGIDEDQLEKFVKDSIIPAGFDFSQMFTVEASGARINVTMKPLKIDEQTGKLAWGTPQSFSCVGQVSS